MKKLILFLPIIIVLFGAAQEKKKSNLLHALTDIELQTIIDTTTNYNFSTSTPLKNIHIENKTIPEMAEERVIGLLLEYKRICHGEKPIVIKSWIASSDNYESILEEYESIKKIWSNSTVELIETNGAWTTGSSHGITDGFTFLNINETKLNKYVITIETVVKKHKTPTFEDFLNWTEERSNK